MRHLLLAPLFLILSLPVQAADPVVHLVLSFSRGTIKAYRPMTQAAVVMPMISMDKCQEEGALATTRNNDEVRTFFWCIEGGVR